MKPTKVKFSNFQKYLILNIWVQTENYLNLDTENKKEYSANFTKKYSSMFKKKKDHSIQRIHSE